MPNNPKTIAFLTASPVWSFWLEKAATKLLQIDNVQTIFHLYTPELPPSRILKLCTFLFRILDARSYNAADIDAFKPVLSKIVQSISLEDIQKYDIELIICEGGIREDIVNILHTVPCKSIWQFDENWSDCLPVNSVRALLKRTGYVTLSLNDITEPETKVLYQTISQVNSLSLNHTIHQHFLKAALIPARLLSGQTPGIVQKSETPLLPLSWYEGLALSFKVLYRRMKQFLIKPSDTAWAIGICKHKNGEPIAQSLQIMSRIIPLPDRFWADPFLVHHEDRHFLFFEEFEYARRVGKIMVAEIDDKKFLSDPVTVLSEPRHLSYPHVFQHNHRWYMVPETGESERVDLYQASAFPYDWKYKRTLIKGRRIFDATLHRYQERWWMFCTIAEKGVSDYDELYLFHTDNFLTGEWISHPLNPVVSDVRCARPAGPLFEHDRKLYRPAQDSRERYGFGLVINEILELTSQTYRERIVERLAPDTDISNIRGLHTFSSAAGVNAVDFIQSTNSKFILKL